MSQPHKQLNEARAALYAGQKYGHDLEPLKARLAEASEQVVQVDPCLNRLIDAVINEAAAQGYSIEYFGVTGPGRACVLSYTGGANAQPWVVHDFSLNSGGFFTGDYFSSRDNAFARYQERAGRAY
jgi:hypothetical protein